MHDQVGQTETTSALDDEFAKAIAAPTSPSRKSGKSFKLKWNGTEERHRRLHKDTILKRLAETHHFDLPGTLVERELSAMVRQQLQSRQRKPGDGATAPHAAQSDDAKQLQEEYRPEAERRVKVGLILEALAAKEGITVTNEDLSNEVTRLASEVKLSVEEVTRMIRAGGQETLDDLRSRILADKALILSTSTQ